MAVSSHQDAAREAFDLARAATLPTGTEDGPQAVYARVGIGDLPEHEWDRFHIYEHPQAFFDALDHRHGNVGPVVYGQSLGESADGLGDALRKGPHCDASWEGMETILDWAGVRRFLEAGWPQGAAKIEEAMLAVQPPAPEDLRRKGVWSDRGDECSGDRLYAGQIDKAWRASRKRLSLAPQRVRIVVDSGSYCTACGTTGHNNTYLNQGQLFWRGAAAASLANCLEKSGYKTELINAWGFGGASIRGTKYDRKRILLPADYSTDMLAMLTVGARTGITYGRQDPTEGARLIYDEATTIGVAVTVKDAGTPVDAASVASYLCSAAMYRRAGFLHLCATVNAQAGEYCNQTFGTMLSVERGKRLRANLGLDEEGVVTLFVAPWVLTSDLANAWARGALYGIESVRQGFTAEDMEEMG